MSSEHSPSRNGTYIIRPREASRRLGISLATFWRWVKTGRLPGVVQIGPNVCGIPECELESVIQDLIAKRDANAVETVNSPRSQQEKTAIT